MSSVEKQRNEKKSSKKKKIKPIMAQWSRSGILCGGYLVFYGVIRFIVEFFRQPDAQLGFFAEYFSMGQILCSLMIIIGLCLLWYRVKYPISVSYKFQPKAIL